MLVGVLHFFLVQHQYNSGLAVSLSLCRIWSSQKAANAVSDNIYMSLFKNQNFVTQLAQHYGIEEEMNPKVGALLQALVENEVRRLLESSVKFMRSARRDELHVQDLEAAMKYMCIRDIILIPAEEKFEKLESGSLRQDKICTDVQAFMKQQLKGINHLFRRPELKAQWVYVNGRVPRTEDNIHIRTLSQIRELKSKQLSERNKKFNIIRDQPLGLLSTQEEQFFRDITQQLQRGVVPIIPSTNLNSLFQNLINYFMSVPVTNHMILCFMDILNNKYVVHIVEHYLWEILLYLCGYEGPQAWDVGLKLGELILQWRKKYPKIMTVFNIPEDTYCQRIKKLAMSTQLGIPIPISTLTLNSDILNRVPMADYFKYLLIRCARKYNYLGDYLESLSQRAWTYEPDWYLDSQL